MKAFKFKSAEKRNLIIYTFLMVVFTFLAFYPSINNDFTNWDDGDYVVQNKAIRELSKEKIISLFSFYSKEYWQNNRLSRIVYVPLSNLSFAVEYNIFGLTPKIFHMTNIFLHIINCLLVFWFSFLISKRRIIAYITTLLFALHPVHVESVAWVSERKDVLYSFFFLFSLLSYYYYKRKKASYLYVLSIILFCLSMLSKPMGIILPLLLILIDFYMDKKFDKKMLFDKIPFFLVSVVFIYIALMILIQSNKMDVSYVNKYDPHYYKLDYILTMSSYGLLLYLNKIFIPFDLCAYYPFPVESNLRALSGLYLMSLFFLSLLSILVFFLCRFSRKTTFGFLFFLISLSPVIIRFPPQIAADRFLYVPVFGFCILIGFFYDFLLNETKVNKYYRLTSSVFSVSIVVFLCVLMFLTPLRCHVWRNSLTLWDDVIRKYPNVATAYFNRGAYFIEKGEFKNGLRDYEHAMTIEAPSADKYINRGAIYAKNREYEKALYDFDRAIELKPDSYEAYSNHGFCNQKIGDYDEAISDYNKAIELNPEYEPAIKNRADLYFANCDYDNAISDYTRLLESKIVNPELIYNRAIAYLNKKEYPKAISDYSKVIELKPGFLDAYNNRGIAYGLSNEFANAISDFSHIISSNPDNNDAYYNRIMAYIKIKDYENAWKDVKTLEQKGCKPDESLIKDLEKLSGKKHINQNKI